MKTCYLALAILLSAATLIGCQAYVNTMNTVLDNANVVSGSVAVVNTMSVPVCGVTMVQPGTTSSDNHLQGKMLAAGTEGAVDIPYLGKPSEQPPQPETWTMQVFGCNQRSPYVTEPGTLLVAIEGVGKASPQPVPIR